jgi:hypothetical protein
MGYHTLQTAGNTAMRHATNAWEGAKRVAQRVDDAITHGARAAIHVAKHVDRGVQLTKPLYTHVARPLLHYGGVPTQPLDRALSSYDSIRRAIQ